MPVGKKSSKWQLKVVSTIYFCRGSFILPFLFFVRQLRITQTTVSAAYHSKCFFADSSQQLFLFFASLAPVWEIKLAGDRGE